MTQSGSTIEKWIFVEIFNFWFRVIAPFSYREFVLSSLQSWTKDSEQIHEIN